MCTYLRFDVDEVDIQSVDVGLEVWQLVEGPQSLLPVVLGAPVG